MPLQRGPFYCDLAHNTPLTAAEIESKFKLTTDTTYQALKAELWGVCCEEISENWPRYNGTHLYI